MEYFVDERRVEHQAGIAVAPTRMIEPRDGQFQPLRVHRLEIKLEIGVANYLLKRVDDMDAMF